MVVKIPFNLMSVNQGREGLEVIFRYGNAWYKLPWDEVPDRYKELYVVYLKLSGIEVPEWLRTYDVDTVDISAIDIEIDLNKCIEIPENYPIGA